VPGLRPREASDRLNVFQLHFDDLWRRYQTISGGEQLFGMEVTDYPELQRIRKELNLLQKLYQLYNGVLERVHSYNDIPWIDIRIDNINTELIDFQNKCVCTSCDRFLCSLVYEPSRSNTNSSHSITSLLIS